MIKDYIEKTPNFEMKASERTLNFLFDFSKSLEIVKLKQNNFIELNLN